MRIVKNSILIAAGKISTRQMGATFVDTVVISGGYLIDCLIGTSFCVICNIGKKKLISFCVDTGFTCFGLVEQNYELPDEVFCELGAETILIPRVQVERADITRTRTVTASIGKSEYETIDIAVFRSRVIGVNKIGYVMN